MVSDLADPGTCARVWVSLVAGLVAVCAVFHVAPKPYSRWQWLGLLLAIVGIAGVMIARWTLGKSFSVTPQARQLVTHGIYSKLRNPIYVTGSIFIVGLCLILQTPYLWIVLGVILVVQTARARKEARVLEEKFGEEYRSYRNRTWF